MIDQDELMNLLSAAIGASVRAGALIMDVYNSDDFQVNLKSDSTPLTLADRKANTEIVKSLTKTLIPVLSEEGRNLLYDERKAWEYFWLVDPLDGTKEFIKRNGEFTVNIALMYNHYPIIGVIYVPTLNQLYFGLKGLGSFRVDNVLPSAEGIKLGDVHPSKAQKLPFSTNLNRITVVTSRSHPSKEVGDFIESLKAQHGEVESIPRGSSLKICMVAEGNAHIYPRFGKTMEWDTAAGQAIAEGAGCQIVSVDDGERVAYNKEELENPWFIVRGRSFNL